MNAHEPQDDSTRDADGDDRDLRGVFGRLAAREPGEATAQRALAGARRALEGAIADEASVRSPARGDGHGVSFWIWRIVMPTGLVAAAVLGVAFLLTSAVPQVASAAEILARAAKARAAYVGWYAMEQYEPSTGQWREVLRANPSEGKSLSNSMLGMPGRDGLSLEELDWWYIDRQNSVEVRYTAQNRTARVVSHASELLETPLDEAQLLSLFDVETVGYESTSEIDAAGRTRLEMVQVPGADGQMDLPGFPARITATFTADRGLLETLEVKEFDGLVRLRMVYDVEPMVPWEDLVGDGITIEDLRVDPGVEDLLDRIDAVWEGGLGFDTAVLVTRSADRETLRLHEAGRVTLFGELNGDYVKLSWDRIPGWKHPTWEQMREHLETNAPQRAVVVAEGWCWWREGEGEAWRKKRRDDGEVSNMVRGVRLVDEIWPDRGNLFWDPGDEGVRPTIRRDEDFPGTVILEADNKRRVAKAGGLLLKVIRKRVITFRDDLGPLTKTDVTEEFDTDGELRRRTEVVYDVDDTAMYREPVRVPRTWWRFHESPGTVTLPQHFALTPLPGVTLDAKWFSDPTQRWPQVEKEGP